MSGEGEGISVARFENRMRPVLPWPAAIYGAGEDFWGVRAAGAIASIAVSGYVAHSLSRRARWRFFDTVSFAYSQSVWRNS